MARSLMLFIAMICAIESHNFENCVCNLCKSNDTIGRIVNDKCYFVPLTYMYRPHNESMLHLNAFPAFVQKKGRYGHLNTTDAEELITSLSRDLFLRHNKTRMILFFDDLSDYSTNNSSCPIFNIASDLMYSDCTHAEHAIFVADNFSVVENNSTNFKRFELITCGSDTFGVHKEKRCFYLATVGQCRQGDEPFLINTTYSFQSFEEFVKHKLSTNNITEINTMLDYHKLKELNNDGNQFLVYVASFLQGEIQPRCFTAGIRFRKLKMNDISCNEKKPLLCQTSADGLVHFMLRERYTLFYYGIGVIGVLILATISVLCVVSFQRRDANLNLNYE